MAILEAMAAGKPVVSTAVRGVPDLIDEGVTGLLGPSGDVNALAEMAIHVLRDGAIFQRMGQAAQRRARQLFDTHAMVQKYETLYVSFLEWN